MNPAAAAWAAAWCFSVRAVAGPGAPEHFGFRAAPVLAHGAGPRAVAMAEAFTAVADDPSAVQWNPGGLGQAAGWAALLAHNEAGLGLRSTFAAGSLPLGPGVAGAGVTALLAGSYEVRDEFGVSGGMEAAWEGAFAAGYAVANPPWAGGRGWSGVALEAARGGTGAAAVAGSAGTLMPFGTSWTLGAAVVHLGPASGGAFPPTAFRAGLAWVPAGRLRLAADAGYGFPEREAGIAAGGEWTPHPLATIRAGYRWRSRNPVGGGLEGLNLGGGVRWGAWRLDYAYQPFGDLAMSHRMGLACTGPATRSRSVAPSAAPAREPAPAAVAPAASSADAAYQAAADRYAAQDYDGAWAKAYEALQADPARWDAWQMIGNCQYAKGDKAGALASYRRSLELNPGNAPLKAFADSLAP